MNGRWLRQLGAGVWLALTTLVAVGAELETHEVERAGESASQILEAIQMSTVATVVIDKRHSQIEISVQATAHSFVVRLVDYQLLIGVERNSGLINAVELNFRLADVTTNNRARDKEMQAWQQPEVFPGGQFFLLNLTAVQEGGYLARGRLTWHGVTRAVSFPISILADGKLYSIDGVVHLDTREFGLPVIHKLGLLRVDPNLKVRFHLQGSVALKGASGLASGNGAARE